MEEKTETNGNGKPGDIYGLMAKILADVEAIGKGRRNAEQNYAFRGIDDVYNMIHPLFAKYGVFMLPRVLSEESAERPTRSGGIMRFSKLTMAYDFFAGDGSHVTVETVGEAMDTADKASNKAMSAAHKYGLLQTFCIPTGNTPDADFNTPEDVTGDPRPPSRSSTAQQNCPKCGGAMWDNTTSKLNPRQPDYKCKNKSQCDGAVWLKETAPPADGELEAAQRAKLFDAIKSDGKALNEMQDEIEWTLSNCNAFANENFNTTGGVQGLTIPQLGQLENLLSARIEKLKKQRPAIDPRVEAERQGILTVINKQADPELLAKMLREKFDGKAARELSLDALNALKDDLFPF